MKDFRCFHFVAAFAITAIYDVILRKFSERKFKIFGIENINWVVALRPYFEKHTILAAALIAGIVGAVAYFAIVLTMPDSCKKNMPCYIVWVAVISALIGIPMRFSGLFPHLKKFYYDPLPVTTVFSDAFSGVVVGATMLALQKLQKLQKLQQ